MIVGYQGDVDADVDPDENNGYNSSTEGEEAQRGFTYDSAWGRYEASIVFLETIRDLTDGRSTQTDLWRTVAHETGLGPGRFGEDDDHAEASLMGPPPHSAPRGETQASEAIRFRGVTTLRFRRTNRWYGYLVR